MRSGGCRYLYVSWFPTSQLRWKRDEVNRRISISRYCMQMLDRHIWRSIISLSTKLRLYNPYIPVFLYGAETWSITKATEKRIDAFDQWCLRRILNITWSEHMTNYEVCRRTGQPLLSDTVRTRCLKLFGHVAEKSQDHSHTSLHRPLQGTGGGVQVVQDTPGWGRWRKICANVILVSRQGTEGHKTEQLGGHSLEQLRHRQAPIDLA